MPLSSKIRRFYFLHYKVSSELLKRRIEALQSVKDVCKEFDLYILNKRCERITNIFIHI